MHPTHAQPRRGEERFTVITGGPGSGKTSLVAALHAAGFATTPEAGRAIIRDQQAVGGVGLPWADRALYAELMLSQDLRGYREAAENTRGRVFFDRGVPDIVGYLRLEGLPVPAHLDRAARRFRYHRTVFLAPPWPRIYHTDTERRQSPHEARRTHDAMVEAYHDHGYQLVALPRTPVPERVRFVLAQLGADRDLGDH